MRPAHRLPPDLAQEIATEVEGLEHRVDTQRLAHRLPGVIEREARAIIQDKMLVE